MKTIYLDLRTYQCYLSQDEDNTRIPYETEDFDDKCDDYILGFRIVPPGHKWVRADGRVFAGEMVSAWKPFEELDIAQRKYEKQLLTEYETIIAEQDLMILDL